jgi:hypothetical protein
MRTQWAQKSCQITDLGSYAIAGTQACLLQGFIRPSPWIGSFSAAAQELLPPLQQQEHHPHPLAQPQLPQAPDQQKFSSGRTHQDTLRFLYYYPSYHGKIVCITSLDTRHHYHHRGTPSPLGARFACMSPLHILMLTHGSHRPCKLAFQAQPRSE